MVCVKIVLPLLFAAVVAYALIQSSTSEVEMVAVVGQVLHSTRRGSATQRTAGPETDVDSGHQEPESDSHIMPSCTHPDNCPKQLGVQAGAVQNPAAEHHRRPGLPPVDGLSQYLMPDFLEGRTKQMKVLHADTRIYHFKNFLTHEECDQIISLAGPRLQPSKVIATSKSDATNTTAQEPSKIRTSDGMFFERGENEVIKAVEDRIAAWTLLPSHNGEGMQVLRYENTQKYEPHWDYHFHRDGTSNGGNRYATVLSYLSDVEEGGETYFPFLPAPAGEGVGFSGCARKYLAVKPRKGDALLFHNMQPSGAFEKRSMHGACPVIKGTKWAMAKWIHVGRFAVNDEVPLPIHVHQATPTPVEVTGCMDLDTNCDSWSLRGECFNNELWMVGTPAKPGNCLSSCWRCDVWKDHLELQNGLQAGNVQSAGETEEK